MKIRQMAKVILYPKGVVSRYIGTVLALKEPIKTHPLFDNDGGSVGEDL